jgi:hypothetical protein
MTEPQAPIAPDSERGVLVALIFALVEESLSVYYKHGQRLTQAQGATLAANWLSRSKHMLDENPQ